MKERRLKEEEHRVIRRLKATADRIREEEEKLKEEKEQKIAAQRAVDGSTGRDEQEKGAMNGNEPATNRKRKKKRKAKKPTSIKRLRK